MHVERPHSLPEFLDRSRAFLSQHEAEHGLMLGVAAATVSPAPDAYWALVLDNRSVVGAGLRTESKLILSRAATPAAAELLAADSASPILDHVLGPPDAVHAFTAASALDWRPAMSQRIYECRGVVAAPRSEGAHRLANADDVPLLARWVQGLFAEALNEDIGLADARARVERHIARASMHVWEVGRRALSVAAAVAPTPHGIRVNNVYTPPEFRGNGYAGALVAAVTQTMLDSGRAFVFLHTDLTNPTSNALYQRIGFERVARIEMLRRHSGAGRLPI